MTTEELIESARMLVPDFDTDGEDQVLASLEALWGHGFADNEAGSDDEGGIHAYRVDRWIVITDSQGFHEVRAYEDPRIAQQAFCDLMRDEGLS